MGKTSGGTRKNGTSIGGVVAPPKDAGYLASETSFKYTYDPETVKFELRDWGREYEAEQGITAADLRKKDDFNFSSVQRNDDGKFDLGRGDYWFTENMSFAQAVNRAVKEIKDGYRNNEDIRDHYMVVENEDNSLWATVQALRVANGKVRISISRYKGL